MSRLLLSSIRQRRIPISVVAWSFPRRLVTLSVVSTGIPVTTIVLVLICPCSRGIGKVRFPLQRSVLCQQLVDLRLLEMDLHWRWYSLTKLQGRAPIHPHLPPLIHDSSIHSIASPEQVPEYELDG